MYSGQAVDTSFPGGPSGQQTIPSHSGEQKPSVETNTVLTFKNRATENCSTLAAVLHGQGHLQEQGPCVINDSAVLYKLGHA